MALTGARGMSEYISRSVTTNLRTVDSTYTNYLRNATIFPTGSNLSGLSIFISFQIGSDTSRTTYESILDIGSQFYIYIKDDERLYVQINGIEYIIFSNSIFNVVSEKFCNLFISSSNGTSFYFYLYNGSNSVVSTSTIDVANFNVIFKSVTLMSSEGQNDLKQAISSPYINKGTIIDFSQESNRNLFVNQLGYPRDLAKEIEAGNIPKPLVYLPFDDTSNLGKNLGTGGNFTVNGTVTAGADFSL